MKVNSIGKFGRSRATWAKLKNEFDPQFYSSQIGESLSLEDGLSHYLNIGWTRDLDPSRHFSTSGYLYQYIDVAESGLNPRWAQNVRLHIALQCELRLTPVTH